MKLSVCVQLLVYMKPALLKKTLPQPTHWSSLPQGAAQKRTVETAVNALSRQFFGYHLVKLGQLSSGLTLDQCPIKHQIQVSTTEHTALAAKNSVIVGQPQELPFLENSIDAFILAHELDFAHDPHQILREVDRAIIHNGYVVIVGYQPLSLASLFRLMPAKYSGELKHARCFTTFRIKDWLSLLGFEVVKVEHYGFASLRFSGRLRFLCYLERPMRKYLPFLSSRYIMVAKKRVVPLSLIKPKWKPSPKFSPVGASMRNL